MSIKKLLLCTLLVFAHCINGSQEKQLTAEQQRRKMIQDIASSNTENEQRRFAEEQHRLHIQKQQQEKIATLQNSVRENEVAPHECFFENFSKKVILPPARGDFTSVAFNPEDNTELVVTVKDRDSLASIRYSNKKNSPTTFEQLAKDTQQPQWQVDKFLIDANKKNEIRIINPKNRHVITLQFERQVSTACIYDDNKKIVIAFEPTLVGTDRCSELRIYDIPQKDTPYAHTGLKATKEASISYSLSPQKIFFSEQTQQFIALTYNKVFVFSSNLTQTASHEVGQVLAISPCRKYLITNKADDTREENTYLYNLVDSVRTLIVPGKTKVAAFGPNDLVVTISDQDGIMRVHPLHKKELIQQLSSLPDKQSQAISSVMKRAILEGEYAIKPEHSELSVFVTMPQELQEKLAWFFNVKSAPVGLKTSVKEGNDQSFMDKLDQKSKYALGSFFEWCCNIGSNILYGNKNERTTGSSTMVKVSIIGGTAAIIAYLLLYRK